MPNQDIRDQQNILTEDFCILDGAHFFIRTILPIFIKGTDEESYCFGIWSSLARDNFYIYYDFFNEAADIIAAANASEEPFYIDEAFFESIPETCFSFVSNHIPGLPDTFGLKSRVIFSNWQHRPFVWIDEEEDHPLVKMQEEGLELDEILEWQAQLGHDIRPYL